MATFYNPSIISNDLVLFLDAANVKSYSGSGTTWTDLKSSYGNTISGTYGINTTDYLTPVLTLNNNGSSSNGQVQITTENLNDLALTQNFTVMFSAKKNFYGVAGNNVGNSQLFQGVSQGFTTGWRIYDNNQGTPGAAFSNRHSWGFGYNDINTALTVNDSGSTNRMCIVAFTVSPTTIFGFVNGVTNSRANPLTYASGTSTPRISFTGAGAGSWNGYVGVFMIYRRALTLAEIQQNFNALRGRYGL
jgi:hypothetical protein